MPKKKERWKCKYADCKLYPIFHSSDEDSLVLPSIKRIPYCRLLKELSRIYREDELIHNKQFIKGLCCYTNSRLYLKISNKLVNSFADLSKNLEEVLESIKSKE